MSARFQVVTVRGFTLNPLATSGGPTREGLSASVIDTCYGVEIVTFRSEQLYWAGRAIERVSGNTQPRMGTAKALALASARCAELNEWDEREGSEPLPPFGMLAAS